MNKRLINGLTIIAILLGSILIPQSVFAAEDDIPAEKILPPEVTLYLSFPSIPELKDRWKKTMFGSLFQDPELAEFWAEIKKQLDELSKELEEKSGITLDDLLAIPTGEFSIAVIQPPGQKLGVVGLLDFGENQETIDTLLEKAEKALDEQGAKKSVEDFEDTSIVFYTKEADDAEQDENDKPKEPKQELSYFVKDSYLVVASHTDVLKSVLIRWDGQHEKTFSSNEAYSYILDRCSDGDSDPLFVWYFNPIDLVRGAMAASGSDNMQAQMALGFLPALGVSNLKAIGGTLDMVTEEFDSVTRTMAYVDLPTFGLLNMFQFPAEEQGPPEWVAAETTGYFEINWDLATAYNAIEAMVDTFQGRGTFAKLVDQVATAEGGPMLHPKKDLIDQLTGRMHFINDLPDSEKPTASRLLVAIGVKDADKMKATLTDLMKTPSIPGETREFQGQTIYEIELGAQQQKLGISVAREHLMIASDVTLLEQTIRTDSERESLVKSKEYQSISEHFPAKTSILGFQKQDAQLKAAYDQLQNGNAAALLPNFDFSTLPSFRTIQKYLQPTGSYAVPDKKGVVFVSFSLAK